MYSEKRTKKCLVGLVGLVLWLFLLSSAGYAQVPQKMNYQGYLTNAAGVPVNGTLQIVFSIYNVPAGGAPLWTETQNVIVTQGVYSVNLGDVAPIGLTFNNPYYLGVRMGADPEMTPRKVLTSVGYAFRALTVESVGSHTHSGADITSGTVAEPRIDSAIARTSALTVHTSNLSNPHSTTAAQVGAVALNQANSISAPMITDSQVSKPKLSAAGGTSGQFLGTDGTSLVWQNTGDITGVTAGTGLSGGGASGNVTLNVEVPLSLSGSVLLGGVLSGSNSNNSGFGVRGLASGTSGAGVLGSATATGVVTNYGGYFEADGDSGRGVYGTTSGDFGRGVMGNATATGTIYNFGGHFTAAGSYGRGVYAGATATGAVTNYGGYFNADGDSGRGVFGEASGKSGRGVYGSATATGAVTNYGGYFLAEGEYGRGVFGEAYGQSGRGVYGRASNPGAVANYGGYFETEGQFGRGVYGSATATGDVTNWGGYFEARGDSGTGIYGFASGSSGVAVSGMATRIGAVKNYGGHFTAFGNSGIGVYGEALGNSGIGVYGYSSNSGAVVGRGGYFWAEGEYGRGVIAEANGSSGQGVRAYGGQWDFYASGSGGNYGPFTGGHEVRLSDNFPQDVKPGMIVSVTGQARVRKDAKGKVSLSSTLPTIKLSSVAMDKAVFGALVADAPLPEDHWHTPSQGERFGIVNALGEGRVWVSNLNGNIEAGDYITTSNIPGYGQRQDDDLLRSYTLGKAIEDVDWDMVSETIEFNGKLYKIYLMAVVYTSG